MFVFIYVIILQPSTFWEEHFCPRYSLSGKACAVSPTQVESPGSQNSGYPGPKSHTSSSVFKRHFQKLPRMQSGMMWRLLSCTVCLFVSAGLSLRPVSAAEEELDGEVETEVLFKPEECSQRSKRGDLINAHYDGFLAKDGSQFYCRSVL